MSSNQITICPVCGAPQSVMKEYDCGTCGFAAAYIPFFAGAKSRALWQKQVDRAREERKPAEKQLSQLPAGSLCLGGSCVAFRDDPHKRIYIAAGAGAEQVQENAVEFSAGQRNYAVLYADGTVRVFGGENSYGQCDTGDWSGITSVLSGPNCTCGVTGSGSVLVRGARAIQGLDRWSGVKKLACGTNHMVGLRTDGQVLAAGDRERPFFEKIRSWKNVTDIAAARGCALALRQDGTVAFAGKPGDDREAVAEWADITAIALDNNFAYGVDRAGKMHTAGSCSTLLDQGRSGTSRWKDLVAVAANQSGVGAVDRSGELMFAGTVSGDFEQFRAIWEREIKPHVLG